MNRTFYVYALFRLNGQPFYVGKGCRNRWSAHERKAVAGRSHKENVIVQIQRQGREVPKVKLREGLTNAEAKVIEIALIKALGRYPNGPLLNQTDGGDGCVSPSEEMKQRISAKLIGKKLSPETCLKMSRSRTGKRLPQEVYERAAATNKARGHKRTDESKAKMRAAKLGGTHSESHKAKIKAAMIARGRPYVMTDEIRLKMSLAAKRRKR